MLISFLLAFTESIFFYPIFLIAFFGLWIASENERIGWAVFLTSVFVGLSIFKFPVLLDLVSSPLKIALMLVGYVVIGVTWATFKWVMKVRQQFRRFIDIKEKYLKDNNLADNFFSKEPIESDEEKHHRYFSSKISTAFQCNSASTAQEAKNNAVPKIKENKTRYTLWGIYWPTSLIWFVCNDFVREIANAIYDAVSGRMQAIANAIFKDAV